MKDKTIPQHYKPVDLRDFIQMYRINIPLLAKEIGMNESSFRNKLYQSHHTYCFSPEEYIAILDALAVMQQAIRRIIRKSQPKPIKEIYI